MQSYYKFSYCANFQIKKWHVSGKICEEHRSNAHGSGVHFDGRIRFIGDRSAVVTIMKQTADEPQKGSPAVRLNRHCRQGCYFQSSTSAFSSLAKKFMVNF